MKSRSVWSVSIRFLEVGTKDVEKNRDDFRDTFYRILYVDMVLSGIPRDLDLYEDRDLAV